MKIQFASGGNKLDGWLNLEQHNGDITKALAFKNDSVDFVFIEHGLEHVTPKQGYRFLLEAHRILRSGGVIRVIVPDVAKVFLKMNDSYRSLLKEGIKTWWPAAGWKDTPPDNYVLREADAVETLIFCHGHQSIYTDELLGVLMENVGFEVVPCPYGQSQYEELNGIDSHWRYMGRENCVLESCVIEGQK